MKVHANGNEQTKSERPSNLPVIAAWFFKIFQVAKFFNFILEENFDQLTHFGVF